MAKRPVEDLIQDIYDAGEGAHIAAFFDFDRTLIHGFSAKAFLEEQVRSGKLSPREFGSLVTAIVKYSRAKLNFSEFIAATSDVMRGQAEFVFEEFGEQVYTKRVAGAIYPEARALLDAHREMGHTIAIVSSATKYQIEPAARELDIDYILCTDLEVVDGIFTGNVISPTCFGTGKRTAAEDFCEDLNTDMQESFFYTDSEDDLPLLDVVGHPRVVNPSKALKKISEQRSWPICRFENLGRPSISQIARTGSIYAMLPYTLAATTPLWALTGKKRTALNATTSIWTEYASAAVGLTYDIEGEEHLWSHRPAVFIFNHQSSIDTVIVAKLIQRDFTGIGKKEIASFPVIGQALKYADMIFIDRSSTTDAIKAIQPVISAMKDDGLSVCLAPEGTRSHGRKLGAFKKGAFHIAQQAGVPIVPIVIHNASDALPKGQNIARAAKIKVTVLPPIKTGRWTPKTVGKHAEATRQKYLEVLGQDSDA